MTEIEYRCVLCFDREGDELRKEIPLIGITLGQLQKIFHVRADDPMYDVWDIDQDKAEQFEPYLPEKFDLGSFDCSLHCYGKRVADA